jgi:hypothetical protein
MLNKFSFLISGLCNHCYFSLKDYKIVAEVFADNDSEVEYFNENNKEGGDSVM